jgi:hypothetical protein
MSPFAKNICSFSWGFRKLVKLKCMTRKEILLLAINGSKCRKLIKINMGKRYINL